MIVKPWHKLGCSRTACAADVHAVLVDTRGTQRVVQVVLHKNTSTTLPRIEIERLALEMTVAEAGELVERIRTQLAGNEEKALGIGHQASVKAKTEPHPCPSPPNWVWGRGSEPESPPPAPTPEVGLRDGVLSGGAA